DDLNVEHAEILVLTTFVVKQKLRLFLANLRRSRATESPRLAAPSLGISFLRRLYKRRHTSRQFTMKSILTLAFLGATLFAPIAPPAQSPGPALPQTVPPPSSAATAPSAPRITSYTLPPDLYRKARNRGRLNFATRVVAFFYGLAVLWFILRSKLSARFRDWAERTSRFRFLQAYLFLIPLVLAIAILQLPLDIFRESILKLYALSVQTSP